MSLRSLFVRRNERAQASAPAEFVAPADAPPIEHFIASLGLQSGSRPMREHPNWRPPRKVLVTAGTLALLDWLREVAPDVSLVPF